MIDSNQISQIAEHDVYDSEDNKIGTAGQVYLDDTTGEPEWVTVNTGFFGTSESFVPVRDAVLTDRGVSVPYTKDKVKNAPNLDPDSGHITPEQEESLYRYYDVSSSRAQAPEGTGTDTDHGDRPSDQQTDGDNEIPSDSRDASRPSTEETMTRSEEQLNVDTQTREAGRARLRKYVVTEEQTVTVPVTHEEVRLEREPITDADAADATRGAEISEQEHEVVLHEEQVVVDKKVVPVERVALGTQTVTEQQEVTEQVRKEQIETDGVDPQTSGRGDDTTAG